MKKQKMRTDRCWTMTHGGGGSRPPEERQKNSSVGYCIRKEKKIDRLSRIYSSKNYSTVLQEFAE